MPAITSGDIVLAAVIRVRKQETDISIFEDCVYEEQYFTREFTLEKDQLTKKCVSVCQHVDNISKRWSVNDIEVLLL